VLRLSETIAAAHAQAGRLVLARAAADAAERNVAALARVGGPAELGPALTPAEVAMARVMDTARQAARAAAQTGITPGLASGNQPVPGVGRNTARDTGRDMERGMGE
jgi:hypothetical protein